MQDVAERKDVEPEGEEPSASPSAAAPVVRAIDVANQFLIWMRDDCKLEAGRVILSYELLVSFLAFLERRELTLLDITSEIITQWCDEVGVALYKRRHRYEAISLFCDFLVWCEYYATSPLDGHACPYLRAKRESRPVVQPISDDEMARLLRSPKTDDAEELMVHMMLMLLAMSGLDIGVIVNLKLHQLDLEAGRLASRRAECLIDGRLKVVFERYLTVARPKLLVGQPERPVGSPPALLFPASYVGISRQRFWRLLDRYALLRGVTGVTAPKVRATFENEDFHLQLADGPS